MNYGGIDAYPNPKPAQKWHPWRKKFLWAPKIIDKKIYWLRYVHERFRATHELNFEYQYAVDVFDLIKKDSE
jgi:hypothetical protein